MKTSITSSIGSSGDTVNVKAPHTPESGPVRENVTGPHYAATIVGPVQSGFGPRSGNTALREISLV